MKILDELIASVSEDSQVKGVYTCVHWTAVISKNCGLASTFPDERIPHRSIAAAGSLTKKTALELAEYAKSDNRLEASIGMAAINSLIDIDEARCTEENALRILAEKGADKNIAVIGYYPFIPELRKLCQKLWVLEERPQVRDLPPEAAPEVLPQADVIAISGSSFINHTIENLLALCKNKFVVLIGPTSPLSPVLFDYGIDVIAGAKVIDQEKVLRFISQGAILRQVAGIKLLTMRR